ncbi:MAG: sugar phosphate isomerase/epimerase [Lentisphaeria bacterium]|nr:sugar phosphate isomerase/epimerase [Lentisphaeria bacterium]
MKFGVQLYNFRNEMNEDFKGTLKKIAELGFDGVEFAARYGNIPPAELAAYVKELGLECCGTMFSPDELENPSSQAWEYAKELNSPAVTISSMTDFSKNWQTVMESCLKISKNAVTHGITFSYHNHWGEFTDIQGVPAMYRIMDAPETANIFLEPDVCWLTRAGIDPAAFIGKYAKRIKQIHLKDIVVPNDPATTAVLGTGTVDLKGAFEAACKIACPWVIYEQDNTPDPFDSAIKSLAYMKSLAK